MDAGPAYVKTGNCEKAKPIVAVDNVCAWPNLTLLPDGTIVATIFNKPSHGQMAGDVDCWASEDGGRTWRLRGAATPHEPDGTRMNEATGLARNGDLVVLCSGWSDKILEGQERWNDGPFRAGILSAWVCRSSDGGRTWRVGKDAFPKRGPDGGSCIPFGDILPGKDGDLRAAIYTVIKGRPDRVYIYRSRDDGKTWGDPVPMEEKVLRNETALLHLGDGKWLAAARGNGLALYASEDDGKTWTCRGDVTGLAQHPGHLLRLKDGRLLLTYGNRTEGDKCVEVRVSGDEGKTWSGPMRVVDFEGDGGYPASVQRADGQVVTAYYASQTEGHSRYHMGVVIWDPAKSLGGCE